MVKLSRKNRKVLIFATLIITFTIILYIIGTMPNVPPLDPLIIVITPTYKRPARLADMTRFANTLRLVPYVHWIVIEDAIETFPYVENILRRSTHAYTYFALRSPKGYPNRGWYQRTQALQFLRTHSVSVMGKHENAVVFFGDDDNSYDTRLFTDYIRHVKKLGMWAVGLVGGSPVESPRVVNGTVVGYSVHWGKERKFAVDMTGFAVNINEILRTNVGFGKSCPSGLTAPEPCFLEKMGFVQTDIEPFGFDDDGKKLNREVLVWHTRTVNQDFTKEKYDVNGFLVEI
ncbi:glycosyltransferase family 43 [Dictyocaulus viviparus]|uniref:Galactosylgalactosylxylosylprotein 3-beta-glucuronosyltransferase n=1 Tax=Dictyocaulus viviparus TaxID=29172 RepID=A0A0D8Y4M9_DICVI|nr:glycosyltransferase family 43 [Dictyocaulus viviparus]